jgi:hypothetical protein
MNVKQGLHNCNPNPPSSVRRHSLSTNTSVIIAALNGGAPLKLRGE